jgi:hypothetical protein
VPRTSATTSNYLSLSSAFFNNNALLRRARSTRLP